MRTEEAVCFARHIDMQGNYHCIPDEYLPRIKISIDRITGEIALGSGPSTELLDALSSLAMARGFILDRLARAKLREENKRKSFSYASTFLKIGRRDGFCCTQCKSHNNDLEIDHVVPISRGGKNNFENLQLLCSKCNRTKSDST